MIPWELLAYNSAVPRVVLNPVLSLQDLKSVCSKDQLCKGIYWSCGVSLPQGLCILYVVTAAGSDELWCLWGV